MFGVVLLVVLLFAPLSLSFAVTEKSLLLSARVFGIRIWTWDTPAVKKPKTKMKPSGQSEVEEKKKKSPSELLKNLRIILKIISRVLHHVRLLPRIKRLRFSLDFGLSDAAKTGMAAGAVYGLVYGIQARLYRSRYVVIDEVSVTPNFQMPSFSVYCGGIITTCFAHIMGIAVVALAVLLKQNKKEE